MMLDVNVCQSLLVVRIHFAYLDRYKSIYQLGDAQIAVIVKCFAFLLQMNVFLIVM